MKQFIERMMAEKKELDGRIARAKKTAEHPAYGMDPEDIRDLNEQIWYMEAYSQVLARRLKRNKT